MNNSCHQFPDCAWTEKFLKAASQRDCSWLPENWVEEAIKSFPNIPTEPEECGRLKERWEARTKEQEVEITKQADPDFGSMTPLLALADPEGKKYRPRTRKLLNLLVERLQGPIFELKILFHRGRPMHCCGSNPAIMFQFPHKLYPGHPSFPSGHATEAFAAAAVLSALDQNQKYEQVAGQIASNRELAGLHFPTDSEAGRQLGEYLADQLMKTQVDFQELFATAKEKEWS